MTTAAPRDIVPLAEGRILKRTPIIGTRTTVYSVWEPTSDPVQGPHGTITTIEGVWYGRLGTRRDLPPELEVLPPMSAERSERVGRWHEDQYDIAYRLIIDAYPKAAFGRFSMGEISLEE